MLPGTLMLLKKGAASATLVAAVAFAPLAHAQEAATSALELPELPPPTVEVNLSGSLINNALGLGEAALKGMINGLQNNGDPANADAIRFAAQQAEATQELTGILREVVQDVHLEVWKDTPDLDQVASQLSQHLQGTLPGQGWTPTLTAREGGKLVRVFVKTSDDAIQGVVVMAHSGNELALANLTGEISQANVERLTTLATKIGVELGLDRELAKAVQELQRQRGR